MTKHLTSFACAALLLAGLAPAARAQGSDLDQLKEQLAALQAKVAELEQQQKAQGEAQEHTTDVLAQTRSGVGEWVGRFQFKGDVRYRNETIDQEAAVSKRNRDRVRLRFGAVARVNDTVRAEVQLTTDENVGAEGDARSPNRTLTDANSRKEIDFDTAFVEWAPNAYWKATLGKMRYPWFRPTNALFFDGDINPEGGALNWQQGPTGLFAGAWYVRLFERSGGADSGMAGGQIGWRGDIASGTRLTLAAAYYDHGAIEGYNAVQDGNVAGNNFGNSTTANTAICRPKIVTAAAPTCIANDFNIYEGSLELAMTLAGKPLSIVADYAKNTSADFSNLSANPSQNIPSGLDTAYAAGFMFGRVAAARTWEFGYLYQKIEKDSLYGQWIDSDFGAGNTDSEGSVFKLNFGFSRNFRLNTTYFWNKTNVDVPASVSGVFIPERDYKRLQVDVIAAF
jgi:hypothetical protein